MRTMPYVGYVLPPHTRIHAHTRTHTRTHAHTRAHTHTTRPRPPGFHSSIYRNGCTPMTRPSVRNINSSSPRVQAPTNTRASTDPVPVHPSSAPASLPPVKGSLSAPKSPKSPSPLAEARHVRNTHRKFGRQPIIQPRHSCNTRWSIVSVVARC